MRLHSSLGSICLLFLLFGFGAAERRTEGRNRGNPSPYQRGRQGWRSAATDDVYEQTVHSSGGREWNTVPPFPVSSEVVDENEGDIQQSQNFNEDFSGFELPPKGGASKTRRTTARPIAETSAMYALTTEASTAAPPPEKYEEAPPEVTTGAGTFVGKKITTGAGKPVIAFLGIPFAKPPVGDLRFKKPVPIGKLETPFDATHLPNACYQESAKVFPDFSGEAVWNPNTNVSEDCLYLNIWIPEEVFADKEKELVPTMMWIYGGGMFSGSASLDIYNGAVLASEENVIVVSTQYRLGPQGFFFLGTEDAPGNMGMWDQNLALRWVNENIDDFGGDPNAVTLFGESCGAASVGYHLLSPQSKIYFKRAVMVSGLPGVDYSFVHPTVLRNRSLKLAKLAGCDTKKSPQEIMECLRNVDSAKITALQWRFYKKMLHFPFVVTIDGTFLPDFPANLLANGDAKRTEVIVGTVQDEGSYFLLYQYLKYVHHDKPTSVSQERFKDIMKETFQDYAEPEQEAIISYYTNWRNPEDGLVNQALISEAIGDAVFICPMRKWADDWSNRGLKVYYFHLTDRPSPSEWAKWMGVMHGDDIFFYFGHPLNNTDTYTENEQTLSSYFMRLFTNFAKLGVPSTNWERYTKEMPVYLDLNATLTSDTTVDTNLGPKPDRCAFWNRILPKVDKRRKPGNNRNALWKNKKNRNNQQWNRMDATPTIAPQGTVGDLNQGLPYPEMGWRGQAPQQPQGQGQGCMMPMPMPTYNYPHHNQGIHGGQGFQMNTMPQYPPPAYCVPQPQPGGNGNRPPPEENLPEGSNLISEPLPAVPKNAAGSQQPFTSSDPSCRSCCDASPSPPSFQQTTPDSELDDDDDYAEGQSFWPAH